jgi:hypothetical protein
MIDGDDAGLEAAGEIRVRGVAAVGLQRRVVRVRMVEVGTDLAYRRVAEEAA